MDVTAVLIAVLLPPAMLAVVMAMAGYEDLVLPADPTDPATEAKDPATAEGGDTPLP
ncbi:hypothetical protein [Streptomyces roseolilacinus]|uniref:Uncharacterized protein n=1 Tax=Streptomyces roseolilacinus TaxID=66904 RepID=A0A918ELX0_9ACTN|nr:hypothetical protein [Streptomyces roseolilacinus]GGQ18468.1 hypothetical protein GCM10010249_41350 [Streptomyces roseolilacinus]